MSPTPITPLDSDISLQKLSDGSLNGQSLKSEKAKYIQLSFGDTQAKAHGVEIESRPVFISHNFMVDGEARQPISQPAGDHYLNFLGIGASSENEIILCLKTLPGLLDYYKRIGLLAENAKVIEVNPKLSNPECIGYPNTSPLELLTSDPEALSKMCFQLNGSPKPVFIGTFLTDRMRNLVKNKLGFDVVQYADPAISNNKVEFGAKAKSYGFETMPRITLDCPADTKKAVNMMVRGLLQRAKLGECLEDAVTLGWIKLSGGSGGDFVQKIAVNCNLNNEEIIKADLEKELNSAYLRIRKSVKEAFRNNDYGEGSLENFWPDNSYSPNLSSILVEMDAQSRGKILANASNLMIVKEDGSYSIEGFFKQLTGTEGDYIGSVPFSPDLEFGSLLSEKLIQNLQGIVNFVHSIGVRGYIGVDFFLVQNDSGDIESVMTEVNSRIPISGTAMIMAQKLVAPSWINLNVESNFTITCIEDFYEQFGEAANFTPGDFTKCRLIPQAFRTLVSEDTIIPSASFKALVVGPDPKACLEFVKELKSRGIAK